MINEYETNDPRMTFSVKYANDPIVKDWFVTKFRDVSTSAGVNGYGGNDWILMRYADVILSLAEVNNYLGDQAAAIGFLDQVRTRAGMPTYAVSMTNSDYATKYPTLKLAILHERRVELAFEHHRWYDLLRTFNDADLVAYFKAKKQTDFGLASLANFTTKDRYYPIPFDEYKLDPVKMYQNPGY
ncbi:RagB/SusD family nutrient uptake outer membrane protein [Mucilaginibacter sp. P25]|uniref:RagB/SusD family nutrient uptake outer membrane protein n=1 Tax=unclassified Mucilaginibacter TaxID=2617802 RepID=UPI003D67B7D0